MWSHNNPSFVSDGFSWKIEEVLEGESVFSMTRSFVTLQRLTDHDKYGLLGVSLLNLSDSSVIITEGVSDYFTAKILCPDRNVLGVTTLGGSSAARKILLSLFNSFCICADNDATGLRNATNWKQFLQRYNKSVTIFTPPAGFKDITDSFIFNLKLAYLQ